MNNHQPFTNDQFIKRLANLCLRSGLNGMPKDNTDQQILLKSAVLLLREPRAYTEKEINERLQLWLLQVCQIKFFDHVDLRRYLVDTGYLTRNSNGTSYQVAVPGPRPDMFEPSVDQIDILEAVQLAREEMAQERERRKQAYLGKSKGA